MNTLYDITTLMYAFKSTKVLQDIFNSSGNYAAAEEVEVLLEKYEAEIERFELAHNEDAAVKGEH